MPADLEGLTVLRDGFVVIAIVAGWVLLQMLLLGGVSQARAQHVLYGEFRTQLAAATAPVGPTTPGQPVALLSAPDIGLAQVVVEGTASGDLLAGPGHRRDTVLPGQAGVALVYGRASTYGAPFRSIAQLEPGMVLETHTAQGTADYVVDGVRRAGDPMPPPLGDGEGRLTLVTAEGSGRLAALSPANVIYVDATLTTDAFVPPVANGVVPTSETAMAVDTSALPLLVLVLAAVLALAAGVVVARRAVGGVVVWVLAAPLMLALAWLTTDVGVRLLPNLM